VFVRLPRRFPLAAGLLAGWKVTTWSQMPGPIAAVYTTLGLTKARRYAQLAGVGSYYLVTA